MPAYTFRRQDGEILTMRLSFADFQAIKDGDKLLLDENDVALEPVFSPGVVNFVMKDGVSGGWPSKVSKERKFRAEHQQVMRRRERDHVSKARLVPNFQGKEAHNWADVRDHVHMTKGAEAARTYDPLVAKEK